MEILTRLGIPAAAINRKTTQKRDGTWHAPGAPIGFPDIVACSPYVYTRGGMVSGAGRLVLVECKTGRSPVRPEQRATLDRWGRAGALCFVVRAVDELLVALEREGMIR